MMKRIYNVNKVEKEVNMVITSKDNEIIKKVRKLKDKKYRKDKFLVEGMKMLKEAIEEKVDISLIILKEGTKLDIDISEYKNIEVSEKIFNTLTDVVTPQGVLAVVNKNANSNIDYTANYIMALDGIQDPGNIGTIIRTLDSANLKQLIVSKNTVDCYSPKVIRSTMGAIYRVNIIEVDNLEKTLKEIKQKEFKIVTTSLQTEKSIYDITYDRKVVVIGNEANGVSKEVINISDYKVKIPMLGKTESLNASIAAGIMIYEYVRGLGNNIQK